MRGSRTGRMRVVALLLVGALVLLAAGIFVGRSARPEPPPASGPQPVREGRTLFLDRYERTVTDGWGVSDSGDSYTSTSAAALSVTDGRGVVALRRAGAGSTVELDAVHPRDLQVSVDVTAPSTAATGGGISTGIELRSLGDYFYRCSLRFSGDKAFLSISRQNGAADQTVVLVREQQVARNVEAGQTFHVVCRATGISPVQVAASAIRGSVPQEWQARAADPGATRLVAGGTTSLWSYLSRSGRAPSRVRVDNLDVVELLEQEGTDSAPAPSVVTGGMGATGAGKGSRSSTAKRTPRGSAKLGSTRYEVPDGARYVDRGASDREGATGSKRSPYPSLTEAVAGAEDGDTLVLRGGSYHESVVLPRDKQLTVQAYPGEEVWLDGSSRVSGWRRTGRVWVRDGWDHFFDASPTYTKGAPEDTRPGWRFVNRRHPMAAHPDQVWVEGKAQRQVRTRDRVEAGTFFVDEDARQLVLGTDPTSRTVRASTLDTALTVVGRGDVLRGIGVRRYATSVWQLGAVTVNVPDVRLENVVLTENATTGLSVIAADVRLSRLTAERNGLMGVHANRADRLSAAGLRVDTNNLERFNRAPSAGGMKVTRSRDVTLRDARFADNLGHGLWCDISCADLVVTRSRFDRNAGSGVVVEISSGAVLVDNVFAHNRLDGVWVIDSDRVTAANNTFLDNRRRSLNLAQDVRWKESDGSMPWILRDVSVYNNLVRQSGSDCLMCLEDFAAILDPHSTSIRIDHNVYQRHAAGSAPSFVRWPVGAGRAESLSDLEAFRTRFGQDRHSVVAGPGTELVDRHGHRGAHARALDSRVAVEPADGVRQLLRGQQHPVVGPVTT